MKKGQEYICKRDGLKATLSSFDDYTVLMEYEDKSTKLFTRSMFKKWWEEVKEKSPIEVKQEIKNSEVTKRLEDEFLRQLTFYGEGKISKFYRGNRCIVKYNNKNILEIVKTKFRLVVMAHPQALTPQLKPLYTVLPPEYNKVLSAKFVFTSEQEIPYFKIIITDSIYYRK